jgi:hypothetical protein
MAGGEGTRLDNDDQIKIDQCFAEEGNKVDE